MGELRFRAHLSPHLIDELLSGAESETVVKALNSTIQGLRSFGGTVLLQIPNVCLQAFYGNSKLKVILELTQADPQSNVHFLPVRKKDDCATLEAASLFTAGVNETANRQILNSMYDRYPFILFDRENRLITKEICRACEQVHSCSAPFENTPISIDMKPADLEDSMQKSAERSLAEQLKAIQGNVTAGRLDSIGRLRAYQAGQLLRHIASANDFDVHASLLADIQNFDSGLISDIAFTMFRAANFPQAKGEKWSTARHPLSVDWHRNSPFKCNSKSLYRCDVVEGIRSGVSASGTKRILLTREARGRAMFLAYTDGHDFSPETISRRTQ